MSQIIYGIGASLGPIIDRPFLTGEPDKNSDDNKTTQYLDKFITVEERKSKLEIPFMISGGMQTLCKKLKFVLL